MIMKIKIQHKNGFTLIELLVVIAIIGLLSSLILASLSTARAKGRDAKRMADLKQLATAMQFFYDDNGYYPKESGGSNGYVGEGAGLDALLNAYLSDIGVDPLGPSNNTYYYYYDGNQTCTGGAYSSIAVIFAATMETTSGNGSNFCSSWGGEGGAGGANAWHIVVGQSDG